MYSVKRRPSLVGRGGGGGGRSLSASSSSPSSSPRVKENGRRGCCSAREGERERKRHLLYRQRQSLGHLGARGGVSPSTSRIFATPSEREIQIELNRKRSALEAVSSEEKDEKKEQSREEGGVDGAEDEVVSEVKRLTEERLKTFLSTTYMGGKPRGLTSKEEEEEEEEDRGLPQEVDDKQMDAFIVEIRRKLDAFELKTRSVLYGRDRELRLLLLALFSQQHVLLLGPSGIGEYSIFSFFFNFPPSIWQSFLLRRSLFF